jgi:hypothetical protein
MDMSPIMKCNMATCAYNSKNICHTPGINVGPHAECGTYTHGSAKGGFPDSTGAVGACQATECEFNSRLECKAPDIKVADHDRHADCETFKRKK